MMVGMRMAFACGGTVGCCDRWPLYVMLMNV